MNGKLKVGLAVTVSFALMTGGVFGVKYLKQRFGVELPAANAEDNQPPAIPAPPGTTNFDGPPPTPVSDAPLYKPKEPDKLPPLGDALPPPPPLGNAGGARLVKEGPTTKPIFDPAADDDFGPPPLAAPVRQAHHEEPAAPKPPATAKPGDPPPLDLPTAPLTEKPAKPMEVPGLSLPDAKDNKSNAQQKKPASPPPDLDEAPLLPPAGGTKPETKSPAKINEPPPLPKGKDSAPTSDKGPMKGEPQPFVDLPKPAPAPMKPKLGPIDITPLPKTEAPAPKPEPKDSLPALPPKREPEPAAALEPRPQPANDLREAPVTSYDEEWYYSKQGDTLEAICQKFFAVSKYEQALRQYNLDRNYGPVFRQDRPSLPQGQVVKVPPARVLERMYPNLIPGFRGTPAPRLDGPLPGVEPAGSVSSREDLGSPREFVVRREGMTLKDIAREELKNENEWTRIFVLNREWNPSAPVPVGTKIYLPRPAGQE